jgi:DNA-binding SARP family transcriptional activator
MDTATTTGRRETAAHLRLLGDFRLSLADSHVYLAPVTQRLLAMLALKEEGVSRARAAEVLWPQLTDRRAGASLRSALWRLSRRTTGHPLVDPDDSGLRLRRDVQVDVRAAFAEAADLTRSGPAPDTTHVPGCLREDLLPAWPDDWLVVAREHFHQTRLHAMEALSRRLCRAGDTCAAMECAMTALEAEPLRESAHRAVTEVHLAEGNAAEALRHYESYRTRLRAEFGLPPSPGYRRLLAPYLGRPLDGPPR